MDNNLTSSSLNQSSTILYYQTARSAAQRVLYNLGPRHPQLINGRFQFIGLNRFHGLLDIQFEIAVLVDHKGTNEMEYVERKLKGL